MRIIVFLILFLLAASVKGLCRLGDRVKTSVEPYEVKQVPVDESNIACSQYYTVQASTDTCQSIYNKYRIRESRFVALNPTLDCSRELASGVKVCLNNGFTSCVSYKTVQFSYDTCAKIAAHLGISSVATLKAINPGLDCSDIRMDVFCTEALNPPCPKSYLVQTGDTIDSLMNKNNLTEEEFYYLNPYIDATSLLSGVYICVTKQSVGPSVQSLHELIQTLGKSDANLKKAFEDYLDRPTEIHFTRLGTALQTSLQSAQVRDVLRQLESTSKVLKDFYQANGINKSDVCLKMKDSRYIKARECFCAGEPLMYCNSILQQEIYEYLSANGQEIMSRLYRDARRKKRAAGSCDFGYSVQDTCGSFECCKPVTVVDICVGGEGCLLPDPFGEAGDYSNPNYRLGSYLGLYGKICVAFLRELLAESGVDQLINWDGCLLQVSINVLPVRSQTTVETELNFLMFKLIFSLKLQYERPQPRCENKQHYCDFDYCYAHPGALSFDIEMKIWRFITYDNVWTYVLAEPVCDINTFNDTSGFTPDINIQPTLKYNPEYEACYKTSYGNGAGYPLNSCPPDRENEAGLCYTRCTGGYSGSAFACWENCRDGYANTGLTCYKPIHIFGKGCCCFFGLCCGNCPPGYTDDGCTCRFPGDSYGRNSYIRGVGTPMICNHQQYQSGALCYPKCAANYYGEGPVCWQNCAGTLSYNCGVFCTRDADSCGKVTALAATTPLGLGFVHQVCT